MKTHSAIKIATIALSCPSLTAFAVIDFEQDVLPIIQEKCFRCHSGRIKEPEGGIRLDDAALIMAGNEYGPIIEKMQPGKSVLYQRIAMEEGKRGIMPPTGKGDPATAKQLAVVRQWIKEGARFGDWEAVAGHEAVKPPKPVKKTRLSIQKYGTEGGIKTGQVIGSTDRGHEVASEKVLVPDLHATIGTAMGMPIKKVVMSGSGRPFNVGYKGMPIKALI